MKQICLVLVLLLGLNSVAVASDDLVRGLIGAAVIIGTVDAMKHHRPVYGQGYGYNRYDGYSRGGYSGNLPWDPGYGYRQQRRRPYSRSYYDYVPSRPRHRHSSGCGHSGYGSGYAVETVPVVVRYRKIVTPCYRDGEIVAERIHYEPIYR